MTAWQHGLYALALAGSLEMAGMATAAEHPSGRAGEVVPYLAFVACRMNDTGDCQEVELRRPSSEPLAICRRQALTIMRQWREQGHLDYFIRRWECTRGDHSA